IIASKIGGILEQVEHNKTGLLFDSANVEQLKECVLKYWNNPDLVITHGQNAHKKAVSLYNTSNYYNNIMDIYSDLLMSTERGL
ncbi:glycosyltransferase, partial [bacterium]|nr:glycosyltransferase [bacterium]